MNRFSYLSLFNNYLTTLTSGLLVFITKSYGLLTTKKSSLRCKICRQLVFSILLLNFVRKL